MSEGDAIVIAHLLRSREYGQIKIGLQRACEFYEAQRYFRDPSVLVVAGGQHLSSPDVKVRRWAYKLVALLRANTLLEPLREAIKVETDAENLSWAVAAFFRLAPQKDREALRKEENTPFFNTALELSATLYEERPDLERRTMIDLKAFEADVLVQKWICLLTGYAGLPQHSVSRRFSDLELARNLVSHDDKEIVEYSIWALHRNSQGTPGKLLIPPADLIRHPANVRRWLYRLIAKTEGSAVRFTDLLEEGMHDVEPAAREGLALGLATLKVPKLRLSILYWFERERVEAVRLPLIDHLGRNASGSEGDRLFRQTLTDEIARTVSELQRKKIQSVLGVELLEAQPTLDFGDNGHELLRLRLASAGGPVTINTLLIANGSLNMTIDKSSNITAGSVSTGIINTGEIRESVIANIKAQSGDPVMSSLGPELARFLERAAVEPTISDDDRLSINEEAALVTAPDAGDDRLRRAKKFGTFLRGLLAAPGVANTFVDEGTKLINTLSNLGG
ncbi:hypothetical protein [Methylobacterium crusticola]|uniref:hypothetical protein n=1 Tax=Methylobacterium crusticola TaxID=1697972 RepID=UPI000FFBB2FA|nr:hypothetical protein [Methylobacterium crusticola]